MPSVRARKPAAQPTTPADTTTPSSTLAASRTQVAPRRRPMLIAAGAGLILVSGLATLAVVNGMQTQSHVVGVRSDIPRGATIGVSDLTTTTVGALPGVSSVPSSQLSSLVGKQALVDLKAGSLLPAGAIGDQTVPLHGYSVVGVSLAPGKIPTGTLTPGSHVRLVILPPTQGADANSGQVYPAILTATNTSTIQGAGVTVNVEVPAQQAPTIGTMAAANRVVVVKDADR